MENYQFAAFGRGADTFTRHIKSHYADQLSCTVFDDADQLSASIHDFNALATFKLPADVSLSGIKWIHSFGAGVDSFINRKDLPDELIMTRTTGDMGRRMAEYCLAYILADLKKVEQVAVNQKSKVWSPLFNPDLKDQHVYILVLELWVLK